MLVISFDDLNTIAGGNADNAIDIPAGPIWDQQHAEEICDLVCKTYDENYAWNGQWTTVVWNQMSVCGCYPTN